MYRHPETQEDTRAGHSQAANDDRGRESSKRRAVLLRVSGWMDREREREMPERVVGVWLTQEEDGADARRFSSGFSLVCFCPWG